MRRMTLGTRLVLGGILIVMVPLVIVGMLAVIKASDALTELSREQAGLVAAKLADLTQATMSEELKTAKGLALEPFTIETAAKVAKGNAQEAASDIERLNRHLTNLMKQVGSEYELIFITSPDGQVFADNAGEAAKNYNVADRDYFKAAKSGKASIGSVVKSKASGNPVVPIGVPLLGEKGEFVGCFSVLLKIDFLVERITSTKLGKTGYSFMTDATGRIIAHPRKELILELDFKSVKGMEAIGNQMMSRKAGVEAYVFEGQPRIAGFAPVELTGWSVATTQAADEFLVSAHAIRNGILIVGGICLALTIVLVLFFARSISRPIARVVAGLNDGAEQVAAASGEVSSSSQSLAEGASEQAASLEETSSSLEEMASMTKQNADHANQANTLMKEITHVVEESNTAMGQLTTSMRDISTASEETSKIIKTIDEIAFQTNLLALNAAVEAARAGEAGAGFAVVADEVRNLAIRAAEAAKNTSSLIEGTIKKIKEGTEQVNKAGDAFQLVASSTSKMGELVGEVAAASTEQAQGIDQVNKAVAEMDKVVQQNAANAEESAAASEELNAQAEQMKSYVHDLASVVGGSGGTTNGRQFLSRSTRKKENQPIGRTVAAVRPERALTPVAKKGNGKAGAMTAPHQASPEKVIPFDEDLSDF